MSKLISVIVPVYKVEPLLAKCIDSICAQTYQNLEIILVDDGSPDNCGAICDEYAEKDNRIRVIHQQNAGLAGARNSGLEIANGDYIGYVDSDDHIAPDMYEILLKNIEETGADIAICGRYMEFESGKLVRMFHYPDRQVMDSHEAVKRFLLSDGFDAAAWDKLYRKEIWEDMRYPLHYVSEDVPVTSRLLAKAKKVVHCGSPLYYYFQRAGSLSHAAFNEKSAGLYYFFKERRSHLYISRRIISAFTLNGGKTIETVIFECRKILIPRDLSLAKRHFLKTCCPGGNFAL